MKLSSDTIPAPIAKIAVAGDTSHARQQIDSLTSLRFFSAFAIVVYHFNLAYPLSWLGPVAKFPLEQGVSFFFVLSGFILFYCYPSLRSNRHVSEFLIARLARIWPAHLAAIALLCCLLGTTLWQPAKVALPWISIANILLLQAWIPQSKVYFSLNAPSWSVSVEWFFYLAYPFLIGSWMRNWKTKLAICAVITVGLMLICSVLQAHGTRTPIQEVFKGLLYVNPLARLSEFALGMATALYFINLKIKNLSNKLVSWCQFLIIALISLNLYFTSLIPELFPTAALSPFFNWFQYSGGAPLYAALILLVACQKGIIGTLLRGSSTVLLGEISYSIYLVHWIILQFFTARNIGTGLTNSNLFFFYTASVLCISTLNYFLIEMPSRKLLKTLFQNLLCRFRDFSESN